MRVIKLALVLLFGAASASAAPSRFDLGASLQQPGVKLLAVEFFATWCKPCMEAVPRWQALHDKYRAHGLRVVVVATQDPAGCADPGWSPDRVICDPDGRIAEAFGAGDTLPAAFLWSWQGERLVNRGHVAEIEGQIERWVQHAPRVLVEVKPPPNDAGVSVDELKLLVTGRLAADDKLVVIAGGPQRQRLAELREDSYAVERDDATACELGKDLSANSLLEVSLMGPAQQRRLYLNVLSVERGCLVASSSAPWLDGKAPVAVAEASGALLSQLSSRVEGFLRPPTAPAPPTPPKARRLSRSPPPPPTPPVPPTPAAVNGAGSQTVLASGYRLSLPTLQQRPKRVGQVGTPTKPSSAVSLKIPGGHIVVGTGPQRTKTKVASFSIDATEVSAAQYEACVSEGRCKKPQPGRACTYGKRGFLDHPINCVTWAMADQYCRFKGARLPTEREWRRVAVGDRADEHPWGNRWPPEPGGGNFGKIRGYSDRYRFTAPVGVHGGDRSAFGALDLAGNVREWTSDAPSRGRRRAQAVVMGGSFHHKGSKPTVRSDREAVDRVDRTIGFRCAE